MADKGYVEVKVRVVDKQVTCDPDPVTCCWVDGPDCIRWTFADADVPKEVTSAVIQWKTDTSPFTPGSPFLGGGHEISAANRLPNVVTSGNRQQKGTYRYWVYCYDAQGKLIASADPTVINKPTPP